MKVENAVGKYKIYKILFYEIFRSMVKLPLIGNKFRRDFTSCGVCRTLIRNALLKVSRIKLQVTCLEHFRQTESIFSSIVSDDGASLNQISIINHVTIQWH